MPASGPHAYSVSAETALESRVCNLTMYPPTRHRQDITTCLQVNEQNIQKTCTVLASFVSKIIIAGLAVLLVLSAHVSGCQSSQYQPAAKIDTNTGNNSVESFFFAWSSRLTSSPVPPDVPKSGYSPTRRPKNALRTFTRTLCRSLFSFTTSKDPHRSMQKQRSHQQPRKSEHTHTHRHNPASLTTTCPSASPNVPRRQRAGYARR